MIGISVGIRNPRIFEIHKFRMGTNIDIRIEMVLNFMSRYGDEYKYSSETRSIIKSSYEKEE